MKHNIEIIKTRKSNKCTDLLIENYNQNDKYYIPIKNISVNG